MAGPDLKTVNYSQAQPSFQFCLAFKSKMAVTVEVAFILESTDKEGPGNERNVVTRLGQ